MNFFQLYQIKISDSYTFPGYYDPFLYNDTKLNYSFSNQYYVIIDTNKLFYQ